MGNNEELIIIAVEWKNMFINLYGCLTLRQ